MEHGQLLDWRCADELHETLARLRRCSWLVEGHNLTVNDVDDRLHRKESADRRSRWADAAAGLQVIQRVEEEDHVRLWNEFTEFSDDLWRLPAFCGAVIGARNQQPLGRRCGRGVDKMNVLRLRMVCGGNLGVPIRRRELRGDVHRDDLFGATSKRLVIRRGKGGGWRSCSLWERCAWCGEPLPELIHGELLVHLEALRAEGDDDRHDGDAEPLGCIRWNIRCAVSNDCDR